MSWASRLCSKSNAASCRHHKLYLCILSLVYILEIISKGMSAIVNSWTCCEPNRNLVWLSWALQLCGKSNVSTNGCHKDFLCVLSLVCMLGILSEVMSTISSSWKCRKPDGGPIWSSQVLRPYGKPNVVTHGCHKGFVCMLSLAYILEVISKVMNTILDSWMCHKSDKSLTWLLWTLWLCNNSKAATHGCRQSFVCAPGLISILGIVS